MKKSQENWSVTDWQTEKQKDRQTNGKKTKSPPASKKSDSQVDRPKTICPQSF